MTLIDKTRSFMLVRRPSVLLFICGFIGVLSMLPLIPQLLALQPEPVPLPIPVVQLVALLQSSLFLLVFVWLGSKSAAKIGLKAPLIDAFCQQQPLYPIFQTQCLAALVGGVLGGLLMVGFFNFMQPSLPADFLSAAANLPPAWYTKLLYGGITEEVLLRWGVMSCIAWIVWRVAQGGKGELQAYHVLIAICFSALLFGVGHLPVAMSLSHELTMPLLTYIILGNAFFGFIAGYLFWKYGLECAILAHMTAHITMIALQVLL
jgi:hypothetical protein